jgi:hypothetical protein
VWILKQQVKKSGLADICLTCFLLRMILCKEVFYRHCFAIKRVQVHQDGLKSSGTHQLVNYIDGVNTLSWSVHNIKKNTEALIVANKETRREINANKIKYTIMPQDAARPHSRKIDNSSFERVDQFKYLRKTFLLRVILCNQIEDGSCGWWDVH